MPIRYQRIRWLDRRTLHGKVVFMRRLIPFALGLTLLAGCASPQGGSSTATPTTTTTQVPTVTPTIFPEPSAQIIAVPGYLVSQNSAMAHGFVFNGVPNDGQPHPNGTLYYYSYAAQTIAPAAVAQPDSASGVLRDIRYVRASGDLVAYLKADNSLAYWELDATNVMTGAQYTIDSYAREGLNGQAPYQGYLATDGQRVVWSTANVAGGDTSNILKVFDIATGVTRTIIRSAANGYSVAIHGDTLIYVQFPVDATQATPESIWRVSVGGGAPTQIATTHSNVNIDVSDKYLVWDEVGSSSGVTKGLALNGGASLPVSGANCIRPLLAGDYLLCQQIGLDLELYDARTGASFSFAVGENLPYATVGGGRVVWWNATNSQAEYITLPTS